MKQQVIDHGDIKVLALSGKITIGEGDVKLREKINDMIKEGDRKIILDLHGVTYIDSSGIGELVSSYTTLKNREGSLKLARLKSKIYDLLQLTALVSVFEIYDSVEDALQSF